MRILLLALGVCACIRASAAESPRIPLVKDLIITTAIAGTEGDYESTKWIRDRLDDAWLLSYSASIPVPDTRPRAVTAARILRDEDLLSARTYRSYFEEEVEEDYPGTTALGASTRVLRDLENTGKASFSLVSDVHWDSLIGLAGTLTANRNQSFKGELQRQSASTLNVLVNGRNVTLAVVAAKGRFVASNGAAMDAELAFLNDEALPLALQWRIGKATLRVVRIDFPAPEPALKRELQQRKRAVLPGLHFDFGSDVLRPESHAALPEIVAAMRAFPDGRFGLEGHTDDVGEAARNQQLSLARAQAVRNALVQLEPTIAFRLTVAGYGEGRPVASNATLEGRAQNRRVELLVQ